MIELDFEKITLLSFVFFGIWFSLMGIKWVWMTFKAVGNASIASE